METLHLNLKKKWFDMILSGEKKEEYREVKPYWLRRLKYYCDNVDMMHEFECDFQTITFKNGYSKNAPSFEIELLIIRFGKAIPEWSDNWKGEVIVLELGNIIKSNVTTK